MAKRIWVDGLFLYQHFAGSGINRYLSSLLREIEVSTRDCPEFVMSVLVHPRMIADGCALASRPGFELRSFSAMRLRRAWRLGAFVPIVSTLQARTLFLPSPMPVHLKPNRLAVTVHDAIPLIFPSHQPGWYSAFLRHAYSSSLSKADVVFTDSEHSKADIAARARVSSERIIVTYLGYDSGVFSLPALDSANGRQVLGRYGIRQPYLLYVGSTDSRKNLIRLIKAYRSLLERRTDLGPQLVLCGRLAPVSEELCRMVNQPRLSGRVLLLDRVPDQDLKTLYQAAAAFAMPSLYEGFGLPVLEAMASGVPVMSSNRSSLPEIGGDAVLYFNPESVEEMSHAIERLLDDSTLRVRLIERGLHRAKQFSWEACARITLTALKAL